MRVLVSAILTAALLGGTYASVTWKQSAEAMQDSTTSTAIASKRSIEREVRIRAAMKEVELNEMGWPRTIDPAWFGSSPPRNPFITLDHPWLEIATDEQSNLIDPPIRQALTPDVAAYWYNPANGIVRARVGPSVTDAGAVDLYNRVNGASVSALFESGRSQASMHKEQNARSKFLKSASKPRTAPVDVRASH